MICRHRALRCSRYARVHSVSAGAARGVAEHYPPISRCRRACGSAVDPSPPGRPFHGTGRPASAIRLHLRAMAQVRRGVPTPPRTVR